MATVRENLIAARALIDTPEKWGKGDYQPRPGCFCSIGAIDAACGRMSENAEAIDALRAALPERFERDGVVAFNDDDSTEHTDIMALFDRAIASQPPSKGEV